ncbi:helix-turn-helix domain-containing protein [Nocardia jinanensis]|uniref:helix-turn-helix domain-containing protein n=1 Tax=Nocardia jinanensis TaxID=382504 RepID=UPI0007A4875B|nr:helix-turn-helix domain-containing protein [Nocardia jinanensis]
MSQDTPADHSRLLGDLRADSSAIADSVTARIQHDDTDYGNAALAQDELAGLVADSCAAWLDALAEAPYSLAPAQRAGRLEAERGIPLESLLHAFRVAGLAFWEIIVEYAGPDDRGTLPRLSTLVWATVDEYSVAAAETYRRVVAAGTDRPEQGLLRALLDPGFPSAQREELGSRMRLPHRAALVVLVGEIRFTTTGVTTVQALLTGERVTLAAMFSPDTLASALRTAQARAGASRQFTDLAAAPAALDQARLAFRCLSPTDTGVHIFASSPSRALIAANPALAADVFSEMLSAFDRLPPGEADLLVQTASAWYELGGSTSAVGERLHLHRNTVLHRLERIERLTGTAFAAPADAALLYLALQARSLRAPGSRPRT